LIGAKVYLIMKNAKIITLNTVLAAFCCVILYANHTVIDKIFQISYNLGDSTARASTNRTLQINLLWRRDKVSQESINNGPCVTDNAKAAQKIFDEHGQFIRSAISFNVRSADLVDEIYQEFFLFLLSKPLPDDIQNIRGFLYRVLTGRIKDSFRKIDNYQARVNKYAKQNDGLDRTMPEKSIVEKEELDKMFKLIYKELPHNEAKALELRFRHERDRSEAARIMGIDPSTVSRYVSAGIKKIRNSFNDKNKGGNNDNS